ncbi:hypothetical protein GCM10027167_49920 [Nocardia heshunensis]
MPICLLAVLVTGCGPHHRPAPSYYDRLSAPERKLVDEAKPLRPLDACGFVDLDSVRGPTPIEVRDEPGGCELRHTNGALGYLDVSVVAPDRLNLGSRNTITTVTLDGVPVQEGHEQPGNECHIAVSRDASSSLQFENGDDDCGALESIVRASLPLVHTTPLHSDSKFPGADTKLARMDPCGALDAVESTMPIRLDFDEPAYCEGRTAPANPDDAEYIMVFFGVSTSPIKGVRDDIGAVPVTTEQGSDCRFTAYLGYRAPAAEGGTVAPYDQISVETRYQGCTRTRGLLAHLIDVYQRS